MHHLQTQARLDEKRWLRHVRVPEVPLFRIRQLKSRLVEMSASVGQSKPEVQHNASHCHNIHDAHAQDLSRKPSHRTQIEVVVGDPKIGEPERQRNKQGDRDVHSTPIQRKLVSQTIKTPKRKGGINEKHDDNTVENDWNRVRVNHQQQLENSTNEAAPK